MFTGLVQHVGEIKAFERTSHVARLLVDANEWSHVPQPGDSIAVGGCCLTVVATEDGLAFDVVAETLAATTLADAAPGESLTNH